MKSHIFDIEDAVLYGVDEAIFLNNLKFWLTKNKANMKNVHDGYVWTFNSANSYSELFPYWSMKKVQRLILSLEKRGVVISGNYNKLKYDRTKWLTMPEFCIEPKEENPWTLMSNGWSDNVQPIPDINSRCKQRDQTHLQTSEVEFFIYELDENEFKHCNEIIDAMEGYDCFFTGKLKLSEWKYCESQMSSVEFMDHIGYVNWFVGNKIESFRKKPSLPNLLTDLGGMTFKEYHDKMMR